MKEPITMDSLISRNEDMISGDVDGETVMMSVETGKYHSLNDTGKRIWELLEQPIRLKEICSNLQNEYHIDPAQLTQETIAFLQQLLERNVIKIAD